ncbi:MAG: DUF87 domain-containing protein [Pseudomonadota bacterium]
MTHSLGTLPFDLTKLMETRLLVQANSGGGKSWCLRRILEQTSKGVQQLVIDPEGEFATLREKHDYIICAPHDADAVANPQTAAALARALWESGASAVLDIYELKAHERILFVRRFLEALINAPKRIWHPTMVVIDEIHMFAPQVGDAESRAAVIDLATRGRKRGLALVGGTQRLSKLHKDVAAELLNKLIGRTGLDVDVQRAADELGMARAGAQQVLRSLEPGEFFAFGPALAAGVTRTMTGPVHTTHPTSGARGMTAPPPASKAVLAKLQKLEGIQREAEAEVKTAEKMLAEINDLRKKLSQAEKASPATVDQGPRLTAMRQELDAMTRSRDGLQLVLNGWHDRARRMAATLLESVGDVAVGTKAPAKLAMAVERNEVRQPSPRPAPAPKAAGPEITEISAPQVKILDVLAQLEMFGVSAATKPMIAAHAGVSPTSGGYFNNLGKLRSHGLIDYPSGGIVALTDAGKLIANYPDTAPTLQDLHGSWLSIVSNPQAAILQVLIDIYPGSLPKDDLADRVGASRTSGGYFNNLGHLRTLGAIDYPQKGMVAATAVLFPKGK